MNKIHFNRKSELMPSYIKAPDNFRAQFASIPIILNEFRRRRFFKKNYEAKKS